MFQAHLPMKQLMELCQLAGKPQHGCDRRDDGCHPGGVSHVGASITLGSPAPSPL